MKLLVLVLALASAVSATTTYVAQSPGVIADGSNCNGQTAVSIATFNAGTQSAGDIIWFDGAITTPPVLHGSGSAGNVITYNWCTGARISVGFGQIINMNGALHHILFDGGIACGPGTACDALEATHLTTYATGQAGIIEATNNGSPPLGNQNNTTQAFFGCNGCHDIEIRNMIVRNLYQHTSNTDGTNSADTGNFVWQCSIAVSGCATGTVSIHDMAIHDTGNAISIQLTSTGVVNIFNIDFFRNNWAVENSGNDTGGRTFRFHDNICRDTANWDVPGTLAYHHNCVHNYMNVAAQSTELSFYNNTASGLWGPCCGTVSLTWSEVAKPNNFYIFNNVALQSCADGETLQALEPQMTGGIVANNTLIGCATVSGNTEALELNGSGITYENNAIATYGQYIVVDTGTAFTTLDYNNYGPIGLSGNSNWQCGATGTNAFATWQSACSGDSHGHKLTSLGVNGTGVPQSGSGLIGAGTNLTSLCSGKPNPGLGALCLDKNGATRPSIGPWDAGAYNFGTSPATAPTCVPGTEIYSSPASPACTNPNSGTTVQCYTLNGSTPATNGLGTACANGTALVSGRHVVISFNIPVTLQIVAGTSTQSDSTVSAYTYTPTVGGTPFFSLDPNTSSSFPTPAQVATDCTRLWDTNGSTWPFIETSAGTYNFGTFDTVQAQAKAQGVSCAQVVIARTPSFYTSAPTDTTCLQYNSSSPTGPGAPGQCDPPADINPNGSGTGLAVRNFVAALAAHVNAGGYSSGHAVPHVYEMWNEPENCGFWNSNTGPCTGTGTMNQLVRMTWDTACITHGINGLNPFTGETCAQVWATVTSTTVTAPLDPAAIIAGPSATVFGFTFVQNFYFCNFAPVPTNCTVGGYTYLDVLNYHLKYMNPSLSGSGGNGVAAKTPEATADLWNTQILATLPKPTLTIPNVDDITTQATVGWGNCGLSCAGGTGSGTGTQTFGNASPSLDGGSMLLTLTGPSLSAGQTTNYLWHWGAGANPTSVAFTSTWHFYIPSLTLIQELEFDTKQFISGHRWFWGSEINPTTGALQIWNQLGGAWVSTSVVQPLTAATWHTLTWVVHRVPGDTSCTSGQPCDYYDTLILDGVNLTPVGGFTPQPSGSSSDTDNTGTDTQIDMNSTGGTTSVYYDEMSLIQSTDTTGLSSKAIYSTEWGSATGSFANCSTATGTAPPYCNYLDPDMQMGYVARTLIKQWDLGYPEAVWYNWPVGLPAAAATGYNAVSNAMGGGSGWTGCTTSAPGTTKAGLFTFTCPFTQANGVASAWVWDNSQDCTGGFCGTTTQTVGTSFGSYSDLNGDPPSPIIAHQVPIGIKPLLLQAAAVLTVAIIGSGTVTSSPAGISCPGACSATFPLASTVTITAQTTIGSVFTGFTGAGCPASPNNRYPCVVTMSANQSAIATFSVACGLPNLACSLTSLAAMVYPSTAPVTAAVTGAGTLFTDPAFGTLGMRLTDPNTDPALIGGINGSYAVSNGGSSNDQWWSLDDHLTLAGSSGGFKYLFGLNPVTMAINRPYSSVTSGCPRGNCSTNGGWSISSPVDFSQSAACKLYAWTGTAIQSYTFGSDVSLVNSCPSSISGPPVASTVIQFIENSPSGCVGTACNGLPSDFGTQTWTGESSTVLGDAVIGAGYSSAAYHNGAGTGQGSGIYVVIYSPTKGVMSYNTSTGAIQADIGWAGGTGLTCTATQCSGTSTSPCGFTLHNVHFNNSGSILKLSWTTQISGTCPSADNDLVWAVGTTTVYASEGSTLTSGHTCMGSLGLINGPGSPIWQWYYRLLPNGGPAGTPSAIQTLPSPNQPTNLDAHCSWQMDNSLDTFPFYWGSTTASLLSSGLIPFDQPTGPWWSELDASETSGSGLTHRLAMTFNSGYSNSFSAANNIFSCSPDGRFCSVGSDMEQKLRNVGGTSTTCIPSGPIWLSAKVYPTGYVIAPSTNNVAGNSFRATVGGTSSGSQPNWGSVCTGSCTDGGVTWTNIGAATGTNACAADVFVYSLGLPGHTVNALLPGVFIGENQLGGKQ